LEKTKRKKKRRKHRSKVTTDPSLKAIESLVVEEIEMSSVAAPRLGPKSKRYKRPAARYATKVVLAWVGLWLLPVLASLFARSPWPVDETRLLAVAWEMWTRSDWLVPYLNGEIYTQQTPLMFWLINLGWAVAGVNEWWPRLIPALFGLGSLILVERLARALWPGQINIAAYAPVIMLGMLCWTIFLTLTLDSMLLVFFTSLGAVAITTMLRKRRRLAWPLLGLSLGLGVLAGGPAIFVYLLPLALLAPFWVGSKRKVKWSRWYGKVAKAVVVAAGICIVWAVIVSQRPDGAAYIDSLLRAPLMGAGLEFFALSPPWWWYLALVPVVTLPWSIFPLVWMRLWHIRREKIDSGLAFCLFWAWPTIVVLSLMTLKQPQLLLPLLPAFALGMAYLLLDEDLVVHRQSSVFSSMAFPIVFLGGTLAALPGLPRVEALPSMLWELSPFIGITIAFVGIALAWLPVTDGTQRVMNLTVGGISLLVLVILSVGSQFDGLYRTNEAAVYLANAERQQRPIAHVGPYDGQFQFVGRLKNSLEVIDGAGAAQWSARYTDGLVVTYTVGWQPRIAGSGKPAFEAPYRDQQVRIWKAGSLLKSGS
jgi:4-amino-4-deoxy-L-arabinose transferase-like glycosyltransferase